MSEIQNKLYRGLEDAVAMETQVIEVLRKQVSLLERHPEIQARVRRHLDESVGQKDRLVARLKLLGRDGSPVKNALGGALGMLSGLVEGMRPDPVSHLMSDAYMVEHREIAIYTLLASQARLAGDPETERIAELNMQEEIAMAAWIGEHLPDALLKDLEADGVRVTPTMAELEKVAPRLRVTFDTPDAEARMPAEVTHDTGMDAP